MSAAQSTHLVDQITGQWSSLQIELSDAAKAALQAHTACRWVEVSYRPPVGITGLDESNVEARVRELATQLALGDEAGTLGPLARAKQQHEELAGRTVLGELRQMIGDALDQLEEPFISATEDFVAAVADLPTRLDADSLLAQGAPAVEAYTAARAASYRLGAFDAFVVGLAHLSGGVVRDIEQTLRLLAARDLRELSALDSAKAANTVEQELNPVWLAAARLGTPWALSTPTTAKALRNRLSRPSGAPVLAR